MAFTKEADFEEAVVKLLIERGWKDGVLKNYTEQQLIQNWANILFENNRGIDRLIIRRRMARCSRSWNRS